MDWQQFIFSPEQQWIKRLEKMARRRFYDSALADQAFEDCLAKLSADNWVRLNQFQKRSSPGTFLICVYRRLLEDFAIARYGKCRAPVWVQQLGQPWITLHKRLCCERADTNQLAHQLNSDDYPTTVWQSMARTLKSKLPNCGERVSFSSLENAVEQQPTLLDNCADATSSDALTQLDQNEFEQALAAFTQFFEIPTSSSSTPLLKALQEEIRKLNIDSSMLLLIKLLYQDDVSLPKACQRIGIAEHTARHQLQKTLTQLRDALLASGIDRCWLQEN